MQTIKVCKDITFVSVGIKCHNQCWSIIEKMNSYQQGSTCVLSITLLQIMTFFIGNFDQKVSLLDTSQKNHSIILVKFFDLTNLIGGLCD